MISFKIDLENINIDRVFRERSWSIDQSQSLLNWIELNWPNLLNYIYSTQSYLNIYKKSGPNDLKRVVIKRDNNHF